MRAFTVKTKRDTVEKKSWQWNSEFLAEEQNRAKELQAAQRRFRNSV